MSFLRNIRCLIRTIAACATLLACLPVSSQTIDYREYIHWAGGFDFAVSTYPIKMAIHETIACFITGFPLGERAVLCLEVVDIADPQRMRSLGHIELPGYSYHIDLAVSEMAAFVAYGNHLRIYDLSDPQDIRLISTVDIQSCSSVAVLGHHVYVGSSQGYLHTLDCSDLQFPTIVHSIRLESGIHDTVIDQGRIYGFGRQYPNLSPLLILGLDNPAAPEQLGTMGGPGQREAVAIADSYAYIANLDHGLEIVDISDPANPFVISGLEIPLHNVAVLGDLIFGASWEKLYAFDVSDHSLPSIVGVFPIIGVGTALSVHGQRLYTSLVRPVSMVSIFSLGVIEPGNGATAPMAAHLEQPRNLHTVTIADNLAILTRSDQLLTVDVTNAIAPQVLGELAVVGVVGKPWISDGIVYLSTNQALVIVDVGKPSHPQIIGSLPVPGQGAGVATHGNRAYFCRDGPHGRWLRVIDISDPRMPTYVSDLNLDELENVRGIRIQGSYAYITCAADGVAVIDISNPDQPQLAARVSIGQYVSRLTIAGPYVYVHSYRPAMSVIDVNDPLDPRVVAGLWAPLLLYGSSVHGNTLYVSNTSSGVQIVDISNPVEPRHVGWALTAGNALDVATNSTHLFIADSSGLVVFPLHDESTTFIEIARFDLDVATDRVVARWQLRVPGVAEDFHLEAGDGGSIWVVDSVARSDGQNWRAEDRSSNLLPGKMVSYRLFERTPGMPLRLVAERATQIPDTIALPRISMVAPNPFNPLTTITCEIPRPGPIRLDIYDLAGRFIVRLVDGERTGVRFDVQWDGRDFRGNSISSGVYVVRLTANDRIVSGRLTVIR
jgi:hypothetical protein